MLPAASAQPGQVTMLAFDLTHTATPQSLVLCCCLACGCGMPPAAVVALICGDMEEENQTKFRATNMTLKQKLFRM